MDLGDTDPRDEGMKFMLAHVLCFCVNAIPMDRNQVIFLLHLVFPIAQCLGEGQGWEALSQ